MKRGNFKPGDKIKITTLSENIEGTFLPSVSNQFISIKLKSGYNISIKKTEIRRIKLVKKHLPTIAKSADDLNSAYWWNCSQ